MLTEIAALEIVQDHSVYYKIRYNKKLSCLQPEVVNFVHQQI